MLERYDPQSIELKWQKNWADARCYEAKTGDPRPKYFSMIEFPYPSGQGLHVGHPRPFTAMDVISRKRRLEGYNVLYPIGYDAFGLPTENYAIKTGIHPSKVTHDEETIRSADYVVDIGPGAGEHGGEVVAIGTPEEIAQNEKSITGAYLSGRMSIPVPETRRKGSGKFLTVRGARAHNLKNVDITIPLGMFVCVTGVSGSGKSSLVNEIIKKSLLRDLNRAHTRPGDHDAIEGVDALDKIIDIDQSPIGRTPRSNPATYCGLFDLIREVFANTPDAKMRGYSNGRFSFNVKGGRCEACNGDGIIKIEMHFLPDIYVPCEVCGGKRYNRETLEVHYKGKSIYDVLEMTIEEGLRFFGPLPKLARKLQTLYDVGLGYVKLGQPSTQLSGGEAQRVKLATELSRRDTGRTLYILDEPTTGLHVDDVKRLLEILQRLCENGSTVLVIEHNLDVVKCADYVIDLGPEGGNAGGTVVATGTPEEIAKVEGSYTGQFLKNVLK